jgi:linoleoyl-CoA desaturase
MESIRFAGTEAREKEFTGVLRKRVNDYFRLNHLSQKADARMVVKTTVMLLVYLLPFVLLLTVPLSNGAALACVVVMGFGIAGVGMGVMHDATHGALSRRQWVNDLFSMTLYLLGSNVSNWKIQHNVLHHTYTNIPGMDEDIDAKGPIRLSENTPKRKYHRYQYIYAFVFYGLMTLTILFNDFFRIIKYNRMGLLKAQHKSLGAELTRMAFRKITYLVTVLGLPLWLTSFSVGQVLLGFFIMHWVASIILSFVFQMAHVVEGAGQIPASPVIISDWHVHQLKTTSDFGRSNKFLTWYVGGLNYQIEHHLFPNICHVHYKKIAPIVQQTALEYGIPYNLKPSFRAAMASHIQLLKDLGR